MKGAAIVTGAGRGFGKAIAMRELAARTLSSPEAQRWLPGMVGRLREKREDPNAEADLALCAQRCVDLASGTGTWQASDLSANR